jgi:hypothetical protein
VRESHGKKRKKYKFKEVIEPRGRLERVNSHRTATAKFDEASM